MTFSALAFAANDLTWTFMDTGIAALQDRVEDNIISGTGGGRKFQKKNGTYRLWLRSECLFGEETKCFNSLTD